MSADGSPHDLAWEIAQEHVNDLAGDLRRAEAENARLREALTRIAELSMPYRDQARLSRHIARRALGVR